MYNIYTYFGKNFINICDKTGVISFYLFILYVCESSNIYIYGIYIYESDIDFLITIYKNYIMLGVYY